MGSGCAELWDLQSAICIRTFADDANICSVAFSPDGAEVLTGEEGTYTGSGYSYSARLWNASTGDCIRTFRDVESIKSVAFSPDGTRILTGADTASRGSVRLWDAATGECLRTYTDAPTRCVAFSPDGTHVLTVEGDYFGVAKLWDAATGYCVRTFASSSSEYLETAAFSPDGTQVLTGGGASSGQTIGVARLWWSGLRPSDTWTLTIQSPQGSGSTTPTSGSYTYGVGQSSASVLAAPTAGWRFSHWEGTAFSGSPSANPIAVPSGTPAQTKTLRAVFVEASAILHVASSTAAPASEAQAPVILSVQQGEAITTLQFNCSIAPAAGSPPAVSSVSFSPSAGIPAPNIVDGTTLPGSVLVAWFSHMSPAQTGAVTLGTIRFNVPGGCELDDSYTATISSLSGTNGGTPVPIAAGPAGTITIAGTWYQVGDVYPPNGPDGGQFGDGKLENADVVKLFYRSMGADPAAPPQASDAWNAGDIYPKDSPPQAGGDGVLSNADVVELFYRSILSQTSYDRVRSGVGRISRVHQTGPALQEAPSSDAENLLLVQPAAYCLPGTTCSLRLLLSLQPGEQLTTLQFNCTIEPVGGAAAVGTVSYAQAAGIPAPNMNDGATVPGSVLVAWFMHMPVPVQNGANLGTIAFTVPAGSQLGDKWLVKIINTSGTDSGLPVAIGPGPDLNLPVSLTGDTTGDCRVNILDLIFIRGRMNLDVATSDNWKADVTGDGRINILDLISVRGKIGASCP